MTDGTFDLSDFLKGRVRRGTVTVPGGGIIEVRELGLIEQLEILAEFSEIQAEIKSSERDVVLILERVKSGTATADDAAYIARFNATVAPYYAALISAVTEKPHLTRDDVKKLFNALNQDELSEFIDNMAAWFAPPDIEALKKKRGGTTL